MMFHFILFFSHIVRYAISILERIAIVKKNISIFGQMSENSL